MIHALSIGLFGKSIPLTDFPEDKSIRGKGMSDWSGYADPLSRKLGYENTFYHQEPFLDITTVPESAFGTLDFLIASDVYEHVPPPVRVAFENAHRLLKPGGVFVFSVPYVLQGTTIEHFPELHEFDTRNEDGRFVLHNVTRDGRRQTFENLNFHGGPGKTLEMRVFSLPDLLAHLKEAGFAKVLILEQDDLRYGIHWPCRWSLPMVAVR